MPRAITLIGAATLAVIVTACNKAPTTTAAPSPATAAPAATPAAVVTYQCHSPQKSRDIFVRFDAHGALYLGADAADMQPTGDVVLFDKGGVASWSKKNGSWTETSSFNKNTGEWDWKNDSGQGVVDSAHYACKAL